MNVVIHKNLGFEQQPNHPTMHLHGIYWNSKDNLTNNYERLHTFRMCILCMLCLVVYTVWSTLWYYFFSSTLPEDFDKSCILNVLWILHRCYSSNALPRVPSPPTIPPLSTVKGKIIKCDLSECPNVSLGTLHHERALTLAGTETEDWWFFHNKDFQEVQRSTLTTFSITIRFMIIGSTLHSQ